MALPKTGIYNLKLVVIQYCMVVLNLYQNN